MFETAAISNGPASNRVWTTCLGMTGQMIAVACAIAIPLISPAVLPRAQMLMAWIQAPAPPPPPPPIDQEIQQAAVRLARPFQMADGTLYQPTNVPKVVATIEDPPLPSGASVYGSIQSDRMGISDLMRSVIGGGPLAAPVVERPAAPVPVAVAPPKRMRIGGNLKPAVLTHRVEPVYPMIARQTRTAGVVELEAVIGVDGRIRELIVKSGHPLLVQAAVDAVKQWLYQPTLLNGDPVEIVQPIVVTFKLN